MPQLSRKATRRIFLPAILLAGVTPSAALLNLDGSHNQLFVFGGTTFTYNSNLFAEPVSRSDYTVTVETGIELKRRAGIITVDSTAKINYIRYGTYTDENAFNPNFSLELNKTGGRTTGAVNLRAYRETTSDSAVNLLTSSWNFPVEVSLKYPINEKFYVTSASGYQRRDYTDNQVLVDYSDMSEAVDLFYVYTSKLDLLGGYRLRLSNAQVEGQTVDHWFNLGATGRLLSKLTGTIRLGYQLRDYRESSSENIDHFNAQASVDWPITRKLNFSMLLNRDFRTIATGSTVDFTSASLQAAYTYSSKIDIDSTFSLGQNDFLGADQFNRSDTNFGWNVGARYRMNQHLQLGVTYTYFRNWSNLSISDFDSHVFSLNVTSRY